MRKEKKEKVKKKREKIHSRGKAEKMPAANGVGVCFLRGMGIAYAITCIIFIGFGILLTYTSLSEESLPMVSLICTALSAAAAGYDWAACKKKKGLIWGALAGVVYAVLLYLITSLAADSFALALSGVMTLAVAAAAGAIGGILGVNRK
ncbi:TIGR04086 family membrane protein [Anaerotignum sp.]